MTDEQLAAIEARHREATETLSWERGVPGMGDVQASLDDVPVLLAAVRRLRAERHLEAFMDSREDWRVAGHQVPPPGPDRRIVRGGRG